MKLDKLHLILGIGLVSLLAIVIIFGVRMTAKSNEIKGLQAQDALDAMTFEELEKGLARAESSLVSEKELRQEMKGLFQEQLDTVLADLAELKAKPSVVHHTTTVVEGSTNIIEDTDFPPEYRFLTDDGMSVAHYNYQDRQFRAETYDLTVNSAVLISEDKHGNKTAHVRGTIESSDPEDNGLYPLEITNSELAFVKPDKLEWMWAPHVDAGVSIGYNITEQKGALHGSIGFSPFAVGVTQSDNVVRFLHVRGSFNSGSAGIGIDPVGVNVAKPLPLVDDIWLWVGPTFATDGNSIQATVSSTF